MHNFMRIATLLAITPFICSCGNGVSVAFEEKEYSIDGKTASITIPKFEGKSDYLQQANTELEEKASYMIDDFIEEAELENLEIDTVVTLNDGRFVSAVIEGEATGDKPHGEKQRYAVTYDFLLCKSVELEELFADDGWKTAADNKMLRLCEAREGEYAELWEMPSLALLKKENFYIKKGVLVIYFPPYELSYYRRGYVEFDFSGEEMRRYLSDYGKELLIKSSNNKK